MVAINDSVIEALLDTGGAKLVDVDMAEQMGLKVKQGEVEYFWGPGNTATPYCGRVEGPICLQVDEMVMMTILELKVVKAHASTLCSSCDATS